MKLVHVYSPGLLEHVGAGNWKDLMGRRILLRELGISVTELAVQPSDLPSVSLPPDLTHLLVEYSWYLELLRRVKLDFPDVRTLVRTHNAEGLQQWHRTRLSWRDWRATVKGVYGAIALARNDSRVKQAADVLLGISDWDNRYYWSRLPGRSAIFDVPYFCPWPDLAPPDHQPQIEKTDLILSMPGGSDTIGQSVTNGFLRLRSTLQATKYRHTFQLAMTEGVIGRRTSAEFEGITVLPRVDDLWSLLRSVTAVAVLGQLGFGLKTTIVDALAAGAHVLVHPTLLRRLPSSVAAQCIACDPANRRSVDEALGRLKIPPTAGPQLNSQLKSTAATAIRQALDSAALPPVVTSHEATPPNGARMP